MTTTHDTGTQAGTSAGTTDQAKHAAATAADEAQQVAGTAQQELGAVVSETTAQAQDLLHQVRDQAGELLEEQAGTQRDHLVSTLSGVSSDLRSMAQGEGGDGLAGTLAREVADRAQALERHLDGREPGELLDDVRRFARQRPGVFLAGALVAGVAVGRLARGAQAASSRSGTSGTGASGSTGTGARGTAEGAPVPAVPAPPLGERTAGVHDVPPAPPAPRTGEMGDPLTDDLPPHGGGGPMGEPGHGLPGGLPR